MSMRSTSSLNLSVAAAEGQSKRSFLFIFVILWFSSLQIILFTWNQIPDAILIPSGMILPMGGSGVDGSTSSRSSNMIHAGGKVFRGAFIP